MNMKNKHEQQHSPSRSEDEYSKRTILDIGGRIKLIRKSQTPPISQKELAKTMNAGVSTIQRYEKGDRQPDAMFLNELCRKYQINGDWLLNGNGDMSLITFNGQMKKSVKTEENQHVQEEQWQKQQEKFKKGLQLMFEMSKDDPNYNPDGVWSALLVELLTMHGLHESGYQRILEMLKMLKQRDEDKKGNI